MSDISVIIPTLNEGDRIEGLLQFLSTNSNPDNIKEIIVVDGGSTDQTVNQILKFDKVRLIKSKKGRAFQLNTGAELATGSVLYFIHADCIPPRSFDQLILDRISLGHDAGCFRLKFDSPHWWLRLAGWFTRFNWRICRGGDQSLFITRDLFEAIGGYDERYLIYEDNILTEELFRRKKHIVINEPIVTSARLYETHGVWKLQYHFWRIHLKHRLGSSASELYTYYKTNIQG